MTVQTVHDVGREWDQTGSSQNCVFRDDICAQRNSIAHGPVIRHLSSLTARPFVMVSDCSCAPRTQSPLGSEACSTHWLSPHWVNVSPPDSPSFLYNLSVTAQRLFFLPPYPRLTPRVSAPPLFHQFLYNPNRRRNHCPPIVYNVSNSSSSLTASVASLNGPIDVLNPRTRHPHTLFHAASIPDATRGYSDSRSHPLRLVK